MNTPSNHPGLRPWVFASIALAVLAGCGGGDGKEPILGGSGGLAQASPTVTTVSPATNATNVAVSTKVFTAAFSKAMDASTLSAANFTLACPAARTITGGAVTYAATGNVATLTLPAATTLPRGVLCTAVVANTAKDTYGIALASNFSWSFTTAGIADLTAPTVSFTNPANNATNVARNSSAGVTFSEPMDPATITTTNVSMKETVSGTVVPGALNYSGVSAVFVPTATLAASTSYTVTVKGGATGAADLAGNRLTADSTTTWTTSGSTDTLPPTVASVNPADLATNVALNSAVNATFSEAMDPLTISSASFTVAGVTGVVSFNTQTQVATFTPSANLTASTTYTATINTQTKDTAGNALATNKVWSFTTAATPPVVSASVNLGGAGVYGTFGGTAGMTNMGTLTIINGDIGTIATATASVTGFHDTLGDIYTETPANKGAVNGKIYTCTNSTTGPTSAGPNAPACAIATQARLDAQTAYLALAAMPPLGGSPAPGANMAGVTLLPGVYTAPGGSYLIQGGNLTLDAQGDANAVWVFQMAGTLTVGGPGAAFPQSIILAGGAQAKNVYWQVGSFATINAGGGGTMVGTIISQAGASFSTAGNVTIVTLQGRALSLGASVTLVNTVIQVPAP